MNKTFHHVAISVRDLKISQKFYERLGFKQIHRWDSEDVSLAIVHLKMSGIVLEIFAYRANLNIDRPDFEEANNLPEVGVKHIGLKVSDINHTFKEMKQAGYEFAQEKVTQGRTQIDYFFVKDPDGMWVEIVQDDRDE